MRVGAGPEPRRPSTGPAFGEVAEETWHCPSLCCCPRHLPSEPPGLCDDSIQPCFSQGDQLRDLLGGRFSGTWGRGEPDRGTGRFPYLDMKHLQLGDLWSVVGMVQTGGTFGKRMTHRLIKGRAGRGLGGAGTRGRRAKRLPPWLLEANFDPQAGNRHC